MEDFEIRDGVIVKYCGSDDRVTVPDGINEIGEEAFAYADVETVILPDGLRIIGESAFEGCDALKTIIIPHGVTDIGFRAFAGCEELEAVTVPDSVTELSPGTFWGCDKLRDVSLPDGLSKIGGGAFQQCVSLESLIIPETVTYIGGSAFAFCEKLLSVNIPQGVQEIDGSTFEECTKMRSIVLPTGLRKIGDYAFASSGLKSISYNGTKSQWDNIAKGKDWKRDTSCKIECSDETSKENDRVKPLKLRDFKNRGMRVKTVAIKEWAPLRDISDSDAKVIWAANYALAKRNIALLLISLLAGGLAAFAWWRGIVRDASVLYVIAGVLTAVFVIMLLISSLWRSQLSGYAFFCKLHEFPKFYGFMSVLYWVARIIGYIYMAIGILFVIIIAFITSEGVGVVGADRLGIPENMGHGDLIAQGEAYAEEIANESLNNVLAMLDGLDYTINASQIESDYKLKQETISDIERKIADAERSADDLSFEDKQKLDKLKEKAKTAKEKLDESYNEAKKNLNTAYGKPE